MSDESANLFNQKALATGKLTWEQITRLVRAYQETHGLTVDGKCGSETLARLMRAEPEPPIKVEILGTLFIENHWLRQPSKRWPIHPSWYSGLMVDGPKAIVAHYTSTDPGTATSMATRRMKPHAPGDREASWHLSIETDGTIIQMAPLNARCWHAGGDDTKPLPGIGRANQYAIGIELVGYGKTFTDAQIASACQVWRALARTYKITRDHAMFAHSWISPHDRSDPGPVWMNTVAPKVLDFAYL